MAVPVNTVAPAITGTVDVGETLTSSTGTWTGGADSYAYQWQRIVDGLASDISGETANDYVVSVADSHNTIRVKVIATNNSGDSLPAYSAATITVPHEWFIVEDGSGLSNSVSFCSNEDADQYHARRGNTSWTSISHTTKHGLLIKATDYMEQVYRDRWQGARVLSTQALSWPRNSVVVDGFAVDADIVPTEVKNACAELALKASTSTLYADQGQIKTRVVIGPIETDYASGSSPATQFKAVSAMLRPYLNPTGNMGIRV